MKTHEEELALIGSQKTGNSFLANIVIPTLMAMVIKA